ncbi:MAG: Asp23/Gls24 family envelope stress response protein [Candidatus Omnitrophica bacterium]|nr:Asp23/Gls24 family envelope stress response protein [Candidatus Omnitrophota bacterium]
MEENNKEIGTVQVDKNVLAQVIRLAVAKIDGARLYQSTGLSLYFKNLVDKFKAEGITIRVDPPNNLSLKVNLEVRYGLNVNDTAKQVQNQIKEDILKLITINIKSIDIRVRSIERGSIK